MSKPYNMMEKVLESLNEYPALEYNAEEAEVIFGKIKAVFDNFNIKAEKVKYEIENYFTRYYLRLENEKLTKKALKLADDVSFTLCNPSVRAHVSDENGICLEIANSQKNIVGVKELLSEPIEKENENGRYCLIGKANSKALYCDITKAPHLLIAGGVGSGKSILIHEIITSLILKYSPEQLKLLLVDTKGVEFGVYDNLPHLISGKSIYDTKESIDLIEALVNEMNERYASFEKIGVKNVDEYNERAEQNESHSLSKIIIIVDEFADLMCENKKKAEDILMRLLPKCRATGIHLILATQRPSRDVLTSSIKAHFLSRIACKLRTEADSKTVLEETGADKLIGRGDLLYKDGLMDKPIRALAAYVGMEEIRKIVSIIKENY